MQSRNTIEPLEVELDPADEPTPRGLQAKETVRISVLSPTEADAGAVGKTLPNTDAANANDAARAVSQALADTGSATL